MYLARPNPDNPEGSMLKEKQLGSDINETSAFENKIKIKRHKMYMDVCCLKNLSPRGTDKV